MVEATTVVYLGMSATLVVSAVLQLYPTYRYSQNVLYERGVKLLSASLLALVVGWLSNDLVSYDVVDAEVLTLVAQASFTAASALYLWANWEFAGDFLQLTDDPEFDTPAGDPDAGFEGVASDDAGFGSPAGGEEFEGASGDELEGASGDEFEGTGGDGLESAADGSQEVLDERRE